MTDKPVLRYERQKDAIDEAWQQQGMQD